ncbi:antirestriction protein ArdA [Corynebacterium nuruki]|uniref:antirestriction protein ArdA n=1 Tax=Corynebacterium nuruki TaxID=1032851 RepID=UPI0039BF3A3A
MRTFNAATMTITPRVWIGCLACYNEGELVGRWYDATAAEDVLPSDLHGVPTAHEELWCMDTENMPVTREMDPRTASAWGRAMEAIAPQWRAAWMAWIEDQHIDRPDEAPDQQEFNERFAGQYPSFVDYAEMIVSDTGMLDGVPDEIGRYFDMERYAEDLAHDYIVLDMGYPEFGVWVFNLA